MVESETHNGIADFHYLLPIGSQGLFRDYPPVHLFPWLKVLDNSYMTYFAEYVNYETSLLTCSYGLKQLRWYLCYLLL